jgi:ribosomal protein S18 acetylase RimI-like enzyme
MIRIKKATIANIPLIISIGKATFMEAHHSSADEKELTNYLNKSYHTSKVIEEVNDVNNLFHIVYYDNKPAGFSKIVIDLEFPYQTKLERIYVYKEFYDKKIGLKLLDFNIKLAKELNQKGMWLYVWVENHRAVNFYKKMEFEIIGEYDFKLTETKSNPNHRMLKTFK